MEDEPVHKPRQTRGTPAYKYGFKASTYFVSACFVVHLIAVHFSDDRLRRKIAAGYYDASKFIQQKRRLMSNYTPVPNIHNDPVRKWEDKTRTIRYDADGTLDADL